MPDILTARTAKAQYHRVCPKSVAELIYRWSQTPELRNQSPETSRQIRRLTKRLHARFGKLSIPEIEKPEFRTRVYDFRDELADTPAEAERTIRLLNRCISWGVDRGHVRENRIENMRYRWRTNSRMRADIVWTPEMIERIRPHLGPIADAFEMALWTGLRQGDVLDMDQEALGDDGWLRLVPQKTASTGLLVTLPTYSLAPLNALVNRLHDRDHEFVLPDWNDGRSHRIFRRLFEQARAAAGFGDRDLHWHDIRGTVVTWLFEAGCTQAETNAVIGHAPGEGMSIYYAAQSRAYSEHAFQKLDRYMRETLDGFYARSTAIAAGTN